MRQQSTKGDIQLEITKWAYGTIAYSTCKGLAMVRAEVNDEKIYLICEEAYQSYNRGEYDDVATVPGTECFIFDTEIQLDLRLAIPGGTNGMWEEFICTEGFFVEESGDRRWLVYQGEI